MQIDQALHGYDDGHGLLASSAELAPGGQQTMLVLSDLSGPREPIGFSTYLTAYPLPSSGYYVFAKTWLAPELPRPGCVWTHSLLLPLSEIGCVCLHDLLPEFRRPEGRDYASYRVPLVHTPLEQTHDVGDTAKAARLLQALYGWPGSSVWLQAHTSLDDESLVLSVWEQQWAILRSRFSFSTGSLAPRSREGKKLDLQVVPPRAASAWYFEKSSREVSADGPRPGDWANRCAIDLGKPGGRISRYLRQVGAGGREAFQQLVEVLLDAEASASAADLTDALEGTRGIRSLKDRVPVVRFLLEDPSVRLTGAARLRSLAGSGFLTEIGNADGLGLERLAYEATSDRASEGLELARMALASAGGEAAAKDIVRGVALGLHPDDLLLLSDDDWHLFANLLDERPSLAASPRLWRTSRATQERLLHLVEHRLQDDPGARRSVIQAVVEAGNRSAAELVSRCWADELVTALLDRVEAHATALDDMEEFAGLLAAAPASVASWLAAHRAPSRQTVVLIARSLEPRDILGLAIDDRLWLSISPEQVKDLDPGTLRALAFVFCLGLTRPGRLGPKLLGVALDPLYWAAAESRMPRSAWHLLEGYVPKLGALWDWDKCKRLVQAAAGCFARNGWPDQLVVEVSSSAVVQKRLMRAIIGEERPESEIKGDKKSKRRVNPDLAAALSNLSVRLSDAGHPEEALEAASESVAISRALAAQRPTADAPKSDLAAALSNLSVRLSDAGHPEEALEAASESVAISRALAAQRPDLLHQPLASALRAQAAALRGLGREEMAMSADREAGRLQHARTPHVRD